MLRPVGGGLPVEFDGFRDAIAVARRRLGRQFV
jgi:hypothetical protein